MRIRSLSQGNWALVEKVDSSGIGEVSGFLQGLGANKQREASRMTALLDRVAKHGPRQGTAKCHQIQGDIWELIHGSLRILFAHEGHRLILCTSGFIKKTQKTPKPEIKRAERILAEFQDARDNKRLEWVKDSQKEKQ
jgi:phage-related protein